MRLRDKQLEGVKFRRQQPIGPYIVDFASLERNLIVEIDGGQHNEEEVKGRDEERGTWLKERGYQVLRFWSGEVHPHPSLSLQGRGTLELAPKLLVTDFPHLFVN